MTYLVKLSPSEYDTDDHRECLWIDSDGKLSRSPFRSPFKVKPFESFAEAALVAELYQETLDEYDLVGDKQRKEWAVSDASVCLSPDALNRLGWRVIEREWDLLQPPKLEPEVEAQRWTSEISTERTKRKL